MIWQKWLFIDTLHMQFSQPFLNKIALFLCSYESWESEDFKTLLACYFNKLSLPSLSSEPIKTNRHFVKTQCINKQSFWVISLSKLLTHFLGYLRQFRSKSHIQGHPQNVKNRRFHLTKGLMGFQALLLEIWAL